MTRPNQIKFHLLKKLSVGNEDKTVSRWYLPKKQPQQKNPKQKNKHTHGDEPTHIR